MDVFRRMPSTRRNIVTALVAGLVLGVVGALVGSALGIHDAGRIVLIVVLVLGGVPLLSWLPIWERPSEPGGGPERP